MLKISFLLILITSCSQPLNFTKVDMDKAQNITTSEALTLSSEGVLKRSDVNNGADKIIHEGVTYQVGMYSSHQSYQFIQSKSLGSETNIRFLGTKKSEKGYAPDVSQFQDVIHLEKIE